MECQCLRWKSNEVEQFLEAETFSAGLNMYQVHEETDNLWGIKMSFLLMLMQWQGRNTLFENSGSHFFGINLKLSWKDDALIRLDSLLKPGVNPTLLLIGQPTWALSSRYLFARIPHLLFHHNIHSQSYPRIQFITNENALETVKYRKLEV